MAQCIQRIPFQPLSQNHNEPTINCQMCNCATFESYLRKHIQYNHMIHRRNIVDILYKLHYPANIYCVATQTANTWVSDLSLASVDHAGCFRDDLPDQQMDSSLPDESQVLCSVCGERESEKMIGCDKCDGWYHWKCVGITEDPLPNDVWFCSHCINPGAEDNLPAEEGNTSDPQGRVHCGSATRRDTNELNRASQPTVEGKKFSESQILIRERLHDRDLRNPQHSQRDRSISILDNIDNPQPSTSRHVSADMAIVPDINDNNEDEDPFTEVIRRKRKKRFLKLQEKNQVRREPIVETQIVDRDDVSPEESIDSFNAFQDSSIDYFDASNTQDDISIQEQKPDLHNTDSKDSDKTKLKIVNTFSIKPKSKNPKSTRLGKRKEKKIGLLKLQELIPTARKPLKIIIGGKQITPKDNEQKKRSPRRKHEKASIFREHIGPSKSLTEQSLFTNQNFTVEHKGKGKGKRSKVKNNKQDIKHIADKNKSIEAQSNRSDASEKLQEVRETVDTLSDKVIIKEPQKLEEEISTRTQNKLKIKRLSAGSKKNKYVVDNESSATSQDIPLSTITPGNDEVEEICSSELDSEKSSEKASSLNDLLPFIYRIHKGRKQKMRVHLTNRNNKMRLSQETIDFAKNYYLKKPESWEEKHVYINNCYMQLKCFKFVSDESIPQIKNQRLSKKKLAEVRESINSSQNCSNNAAISGEKENSNLKTAKNTTHSSREHDTLAKISGHQMTEDCGVKERQPIMCTDNQSEESIEADSNLLVTQKHHRIKSSITKRPRKPSFTGKTKIAMNLSADALSQTKLLGKSKGLAPQRNRLNNILDNLRTKNLERNSSQSDSIESKNASESSVIKSLDVKKRYENGSIVWAKMEESPWWPGMVALCPDSRVFYWVEPGVATPSWYHIVFFDKGEQVTHSWVRSESIQQFDPEKPLDHSSLVDADRYRLDDSLSLAVNCLKKTVQERIETFSLSSTLAEAKKGRPEQNNDPNHSPPSTPLEPSFIDTSDPFSPIKIPHIPDEEEQDGKEERKPIKCKLTEETKKIDENLFHCLMCDDNVVCTRETVTHHLSNHRVTLQDYPRIFVSHKKDKEMKLIGSWIKKDATDSESSSLVTSRPEASVDPGVSISKHTSSALKKEISAGKVHNFTSSNKIKENSEMKLVEFRGDDNDKAAEVVRDDSNSTLIDDAQPVKDWVTAKPEYFSGYSVVIKKRERRLANLELAFSNTPPPPPPKERVAQEPIYPSPRIARHKLEIAGDHQSKSGSSPRAASSSTGKIKGQYHEQIGPSKKMAEQANTNQEESSEKLSKTKKQESTNADGMNGKEIMLVSHSVEALIRKPVEKPQYTTDKGKLDEDDTIRKQHAPDFVKETADKEKKDEGSSDKVMVEIKSEIEEDVKKTPN